MLNTTIRPSMGKIKDQSLLTLLEDLYFVFPPLHIPPWNTYFVCNEQSITSGTLNFMFEATLAFIN